MQIEHLRVDDYENVAHFTDTDFSAFIALHNTALGPALGGCRVWQYKSDDDALRDVLCLSKGMSYKNSLAGLHYGGGKCVVNAPKCTPDILRLVGEAVNHFSGSYITAEDVGTTFQHMEALRTYTPHIAAIEATCDGSAWTALGVSECIRAMVDPIVLGKRMNVWVQGLGKVGWDLAQRLAAAGYGVYVTDLLKDRVDAACQQFGAKPYTSDDDVQIYAPCAMGQVITQMAINTNRMDFSVICGSANNQLESDDLAADLYNFGVIYCPDFLVNAGGVIAAAHEISGYDERAVHKQVAERGNVLKHVVAMSGYLHTTPLDVALAMAELRW